MTEEEATIRIEPYFLKRQGLTYLWGINNDPVVPSKDNKNELTVRQSPGVVGESIINAVVNSPYQSLNSSITINFGQSKSNF